MEHLVFPLLLKLYESKELYYTFPVENRAQAAFLAKAWISPRYKSAGTRSAKLQILNLLVNQGWLIKVYFQRAEVTRVLYALGVPQARLWNEWFGGVTAVMPRSEAKPRPWKVTFDDPCLDEVPF
jgi:hypothetical protein